MDVDKEAYQFAEDVSKKMHDKTCKAPGLGIQTKWLKQQELCTCGILATARLIMSKRMKGSGNGEDIQNRR